MADLISMVKNGVDMSVFGNVIAREADVNKKDNVCKSSWS